MITRDLKISKMLKQYLQTLDILIKTSSHFKKLNNPFLRRSLASRVNIEQAALVAGVPLNDLLLKLNDAIGEVDQAQQLFKEDNNDMNNADANTNIAKHPDELPKGKIILLDVRPIIKSGRDPFKDIMGKAKALGDNETLMIINTFEPVPLYSVLGKKGFAHKTFNENGEWKIYFFKQNNSTTDPNVEIKKPEFNEDVFELDVRNLEPPEPMVKILETLPKLGDKTILVVHHHREPLMLYDKLTELGYNTITNKIKDSYYKIIITKTQKD
jgi:uncharacterized protein (DUF2249 family)